MNITDRRQDSKETDRQTGNENKSMSGMQWGRRGHRTREQWSHKGRRCLALRKDTYSLAIHKSFHVWLYSAAD